MTGVAPDAGRGGGHPLELLSAYLDGELPDAAAAGVETHVAVCAACRIDLDELAEARTLLRDLPLVAAPAGFTADVVRRRRRAGRRGAVLAAAAAGVALVAAVAVPDASVDTGDTVPTGDIGDPNRSQVADAPGDAPGAPAERFVRVPATSADRGPSAAVSHDADPSFADRAAEAVSGLLRAVGG